MSDLVNHPKHYASGKIEVIDFIEDKELGFNLGNVVKYVSRAGKKDPATYEQDLRKALWYLNRELKKIQEGEQPSFEPHDSPLKLTLIEAFKKCPPPTSIKWFLQRNFNGATIRDVVNCGREYIVMKRGFGKKKLSDLEEYLFENFELYLKP